MNKKCIKKWVFGLFSVSLLSCLFGFSLSKEEVKADSFNSSSSSIRAYEWANYFNSNGTVVYEPSHLFSSTWDIAFSPVNYGKNINSFSLVVDDTSNFDAHDTYIFSIGLSMFQYGSTSHPLSSLNVGNYSFSFKMSTSGDSRVSLVPYDTYLFVGSYSDENDDGYYMRRRGTSFHLNDYTYFDSWYADWNYIELYFRIRNADLLNVGDVLSFSEFQLNSGTELYTYSNYFFSLLDLPDPLPQKVTSSNGSSTPDVPDVPTVNESYEEGFLAGLAQAQYGIFSSASFKLHLANSMEHDISEIYDVEPDYIYGGLDFSSVYRNYHQNYPDINYCFLTISFSSPVSLSSLDLLSYGDSSLYYYVQSGTGLLVSRPWSLSLDAVLLSDSLLWRNSNVWGDLSNALSYQSISISSTGYFDQIQTFTFPSLSSLNGFKLLVSNNEYSAGFDVGSSSVNTDSYDKGYEYGYSVGNNVGYNTGYYDGHMAGLSEDPYGFVDFAFSLLDMPGRIIYNWLNFDFLGINLAGLVASIITLIVVSFVLKNRL